MRIACVGGGPGGLYFSILRKLRNPAEEITVHERNPAGSTYGWGVTYWAGLLDRLGEGDPESARAIAEHSVRWSDGVAYVREARTTHRGDEGFGIGRHRMLDLLTERATSLGVRVIHDSEITSTDQLRYADLIVAADGVHSVLRQRHSTHFGTEVSAGRNMYVWLGTTKVFDAFSFAFTETAHGWIWAYAYRFSADRSTVVVECSPTTWYGLGLDRLTQDEGLRLLEGLFSRLLDGHPLTGRGRGDVPGQWHTFRTLTNRRWSRGKLVLLGDAAHTTHYSIGAGTTLALEDALALDNALAELPEPDGLPSWDTALAGALGRYERVRSEQLLPVQSAARYSARWYENLPRYVDLEPEQMFALLGQRHSPLLPHIPPQLYYRLDRAAGQLEPLRKFKRWFGPRMARTLQSSRGQGR